MNRIVIPAHVMQQVIDCAHGSRTILPVRVAWPELQLTFEQQMENAAAISRGKTPPHADPARIELVFER